MNSKNYVMALSVVTLCLGLNAPLRAETSESRSLDKPSDLNRASKLLDKQVLGNDQQKLGKIRDFVFDFKTGKISYAVLGVPSGFLNSNEKLLAVPLRAFTPERDKDSLVLNADKSNVEQAQAFDRYHWPDLGSSAWGAQPFWQEKNNSDMQNDDHDSNDQNNPADSPKPPNQDNDSESPDRDMDQPAAAIDSSLPQTIPAVKIDTANSDDDVVPVTDDDDQDTDMEPSDTSDTSDLSDPDNDDTDVDPASPDDNPDDMDDPEPSQEDSGINPDDDTDTDTSDATPSDNDDDSNMDTPDPDQEPVDPGANQDDDGDDDTDLNDDSTDTTTVLFVVNHLSSPAIASAETDDDGAVAATDDDREDTDEDVEPVTDRETTSDTIPNMDMMGTATETNRLNSPANRHSQGTSTENDNHTSRQSVMQQHRAGQQENAQMSAKEPTRYNRAHTLIGMWVRNPQNQDLGFIKDIVIDFDKEQIAYVVMAHSEILGLKEKLFAIPLTAFRPSEDQRYLMLDASKDSIKQAQGLTENTLPNVHTPSWGAQPFWKEPTAPALDTGVRPGTEPGRSRGNNTQSTEPPAWQDY